MEFRELGPDGQSALERALGYLNFSSGNEDPQFLANLNLLYATIERTNSTTAEDVAPSADSEPTCRTLLRMFSDRLDELKGTSSTFQDTHQVEQTLVVMSDQLLSGYLEYHSDLLFHQTEQSLYRPFMLGRFFEEILHSLQADGPEPNVERMIERLSDYVGHRPVATLEGRSLEPYPHERTRPVPIYVRDVGVGVGRYAAVVQRALEMLQATDPSILRAASFYPDHLRELALDSRAYDFDHPANKRPNYHFGQWDPHTIDTRGLYYRFVVQQVTLDALMERQSRELDIPPHELVTESAAVLAGTILMASGISGYSPDTFDSTITLSKLLPGIAGYRDAFYECLIKQLEQQDPPHARRLTNESRRLRQPFGAARQHLNAQLTRKRAAQLEHVRLAGVFARMGKPEAAQRKINAVPVASARMVSQIDCNLTRADRAIEQTDLATAQQLLRSSRAILNRGIHCGAIIDPWNVLGFDGNFSLFPAMENSIHDQRVDELIDLIDEMFDIYGRLWSSAASVNDESIADSVAMELEDFAKWWHKYAIHEVSSVDVDDSMQQFTASRNVASALKHWHTAGQERGALNFWAPYVTDFDSPKAYAMVISMLLERDDLVAARGLLIHWLGQAESVALEQGEHSFYNLASAWLIDVLKIALPNGSTEQTEVASPCDARLEDWQRVQKFFDYVEANAGCYWSVPDFGAFEGVAGKRTSKQEPESQIDEPEADVDEEEDLYGAAYEDVVYRDSTDDGVEGSVYDTSSGENGALDETHDQIVGRLAFLNSLSKWRRIVSIAWMLCPEDAQRPPEFEETLRGWLRHAQKVRRELEDLVMEVWRHRLQRPTQDYLSLAEFDRSRMIKESLMEHIVVTCVETAQSAHFIICALHEDTLADNGELDLCADERLAIRLVRLSLQGRRKEAKAAWAELQVALRTEAVLYIPLVRGGNPQSIIGVRIRQQMLRTLLSWLPRLGMLTETRELIDVIRQMERNVPAGPGAVTEFDDLFEVGFRALVDSVIRATNVDEARDLGPSSENGSQLVSCLESMTESMLVTWLSHSRTLRLSVLEKVKATGPWQELVEFIKNFGADLFTQHFLSLANVRSILYQGVDAWLEQMEESLPEDMELKLIDALDKQVSREDAVRHLTMVLEAIVENYSEYRDYNSTTTQSDRGDLLYNLLDFLRLLSNYERVVWNLKPVIVAHELLVRRECNTAAQMWRRALSDRISEEADRYQDRLTTLQRRYAMKLPTIADRVGERFLRPLIIDRMRALVKPSIDESTDNAFTILEDEADLLTRHPSGVGFDPPAWLVALEDEVRRTRRHARFDDSEVLNAILPAIELTIEQVSAQIADWDADEG